MSANPFEAFGAAVEPVAVRRRREAQERRAAQRGAQAERELAEERTLTKLYRAYRRGRLQRLVEGPHGREALALLAFVRRMTLDDAEALIDRVEAADWARDLDPDDRFTLLNLLGRGIARVRERNGLEPFNDGGPGDPPRAFEQIKDVLGCR
jgi:hypothetical protein